MMNDARKLRELEMAAIREALRTHFNVRHAGLGLDGSGICLLAHVHGEEKVYTWGHVELSHLDPYVLCAAETLANPHSEKSRYSSVHGVGGGEPRLLHEFVQWVKNETLKITGFSDDAVVTFHRDGVVIRDACAGIQHVSLEQWLDTVKCSRPEGFAALCAHISANVPMYAPDDWRRAALDDFLGVTPRRPVRSEITAEDVVKEFAESNTTAAVDVGGEEGEEVY